MTPKIITKGVCQKVSGFRKNRNLNLDVSSKYSSN